MREGDDREREGGEPSFRVIDRRRFAPDGSERTADDAETTADEPAAAGRRSETSSTPSGPAMATGRGEPEPSTQFGEPRGEPYDADESLEPTFGTLVLSLSTQALMCLGEIPEGPGGETRRDLGAARNIIDLLGVLERKTQGNLTADEQALLSRILYDLRIRFVQLSRNEGA